MEVPIPTYRNKRADPSIRFPPGNSRRPRDLALSKRQLLHFLSRTPFVDSVELALILGEPHTTVYFAAQPGDIPRNV